MIFLGCPMRTIACAMLLLAGAAFAQDSPGPWSTHWAKCKEGSYVKARHTYTSKGETKNSTSTFTLKKITRDEVYLEGSRQDEGKAPVPLERKIRLKGIPRGQDDDSKRVGEEVLEIDGKKFKCEIREAVVEGVKTKMWICKETAVAGGFLKIEMGEGAFKSLSKVVRTSEKVKVGDRELDCAVEEWTVEIPGAKAAGKIWLSDAVPGMEVRSETTSESKHGKESTTYQVIEFEKK